MWCTAAPSSDPLKRSFDKLTKRTDGYAAFNLKTFKIDDVLATLAAVATRLAKFQKQEKEHIDIAPVYLGFDHDYRNLAREVKPVKMGEMIKADFKIMSKSKYDYHSLKDFFELRASGGGYQPKTLKTKNGGKYCMFDVDHFLPDNLGGPNHPRNYVVMHASMNRTFQDLLPEHEMAYGQKHNSNTVNRKVAKFIRDMTTQLAPARKKFFADVGKSGGMKRWN